jgi:hypothetical protein
MQPYHFIKRKPDRKIQVAKKNFETVDYWINDSLFCMAFLNWVGEQFSNFLNAL